MVMSNESTALCEENYLVRFFVSIIPIIMYNYSIISKYFPLYKFLLYTNSTTIIMKNLNSLCNLYDHPLKIYNINSLNDVFIKG
jgi:hypothetical protein